MQNFLKYSLIFILPIFVGCSKSKVNLPDLRESFAYNDTKPFGSSVAFSMLQNAYPNNEVELIKKSFSKNYEMPYDTNALYINISKNYLIDNEGGNSLMKFVKKGNTAFISAAYFDSSFFERFYCTQNNIGYQKELFSYLQNTNTNMVEELKVYKDSFNYFYKGFKNYFPELNADYARYVGVNENGEANMFVFFYGKGKFIFHNEPRALSNYFLLTNNNYLYLQSIYKMLPESPSNVYWDNYYPKVNFISKGDGKKGSLLNAIASSSVLLLAFLTVLGLFIFYLLFNGKRKQRLVPVIKQPENTTVAFAEAIAGLYLNKKDNKFIADKMITYFNEHNRTKYFFNTTINEESYIDTLSRKSGVPFELVNELALQIKQTNARVKLTDTELLNLNSLIEKFLKHKK